MARVIGIDLGTTNTAVAVLDGGRPRVLEDDRGYKVLPSVVSAKGEGRFVVGQAAHNLIITAPERTVYATKRLIGRRFDSPEVQRVLTRVQYKLRPAADGGVQMLVGDQWMTPTEVAAVILQVARGIAERALGDTVSDAVITVPAYFNHAQRKATLEAAQLAGLPCERLLNEPTAAALAYGLKKNIDRTLVLFDLGGGTFDVSVVKLSGGIYEILSTTGDTFLGGEDFDYRLVDHLLDGFQSRTGLDVRKDRAALQRVKDAAERAKCELSFSDRTNVVIPQLAQGRSLETEVSRTTLESVTGDLIDRCLQIARTAVTDAGLSLSDIEDVILVGGQTRMPKVREAVTGVFGRDPSRSVHPEEVVAIGAAVHAANLDAGEASSTVLLDVTPFDLGIDAAGGMFVPVVARNSRIPASESRVFATVTDRQESVRVVVRQGDARVSAQNELLGEFVLEGLTPAPRLQTKVDVTFRIDANGMLHVSATERGTGEKKQISIRNFAERALAPQLPDPAKVEAEPKKEEAAPKKKVAASAGGTRRSLVDVLLGRRAAPKKAGGAPGVAAPSVAGAGAAVATGAETEAALAAGGAVAAAVGLAEVAASAMGGAEVDGAVDVGAEEIDDEGSVQPTALLSEVEEVEETRSEYEARLEDEPYAYGEEGGEDEAMMLAPLMEPLEDTGLVSDIGEGANGFGMIEEEAYGDVSVGLGLAGGFGAGAGASLLDEGDPAGDVGGELLDGGGDLVLSDLFGKDGLDDLDVADPYASPPASQTEVDLDEVFGLGGGSDADAAARSAADAAPLDPFSGMELLEEAPLDPFEGMALPDPAESWEVNTAVEHRPSSVNAPLDLYSTPVPEEDPLDEGVLEWSVGGTDDASLSGSVAPGELVDGHDDLADIFASPDLPSKPPQGFAVLDEVALPEVALPEVVALPGEFEVALESPSDTSEVSVPGPVDDPFLDPDLLASPGLLDLNPLDEHGQEVYSTASGADLEPLDEPLDLEELLLRELDDEDTAQPGAVAVVRPGRPNPQGFALLDEVPRIRPLSDASGRSSRPSGGGATLSDAPSAEWSLSEFVSDALTRPGNAAETRDTNAPTVPFTRRPARVRLQYREADAFASEYRENLRKNGAFVRTDKPLPVGRECLLEITAPGLLEPLVFPARVTFVATAAVGREAGMGVEYRLGEGERTRIEGVLRRISAA